MASRFQICCYQAISLRTVVSVTAILRQLAGDLHLPLEAMVVVSWSWLRPSVVTVLQCRSTKVGGNQRGIVRTITVRRKNATGNPSQNEARTPNGRPSVG